MLGNLNGSVTVGVLPVKQLFQLTELLQSGQSSYSQGVLLEATWRRAVLRVTVFHQFNN